MPLGGIASPPGAGMTSDDGVGRLNKAFTIMNRYSRLRPSDLRPAAPRLPARWAARSGTDRGDVRPSRRVSGRTHRGGLVGSPIDHVRELHVLGAPQLTHHGRHRRAPIAPEQAVEHRPTLGGIRGRRKRLCGLWAGRGRELGRRAGRGLDRSCSSSSRCCRGGGNRSGGGGQRQHRRGLDVVVLRDERGIDLGEASGALLAVEDRRVGARRSRKHRGRRRIRAHFGRRDPVGPMKCAM